MPEMRRAPAAVQPARGPARQGSLREHNLRLVLSHVLDASTPPSRADVATATGLTRGTVSALVDLLVAARLITELPPVATARAGRPAVPLTPAAGTVAGLGAEVNVDYIGVLARDLSGRELARQVRTGDYRHSDPARVLADLADLAARVRADLPAGIRIAGVCLALPGLVDRRTGPLRLAPNLGWRDVDVAGILAGHAAFDGLPIRLANEANLAARAQLRTAPEPSAASFLYVSGEVGIGAAIVVDGEVFGGRHGWSGELGHTVIDRDGPLCTCGARGCLEQYAGKDALLAAAGRGVDDPASALAVAAASGDRTALAALDLGGRALGLALANFVNLVDVEHVVLGGIYAPLAPWLRDPVLAQLDHRVLASAWAHARVTVTTAGPYAAMTGAALAILRTVAEDPAAWVPMSSVIG